MITGMMLGDGTLKQECRYPSFWVEQKDQEFVQHLWEKFNKLNLVISPYRKRIKIDKRLNINGVQYKDSITYFFRSCSLPYFQKLMKKWYTISGKIDHRGRGKKTKIVPKDLKLTPISLAYWIAGDGSFDKKNKCLVIHTNSFTLEEDIFLSELLLKKFGLNFSIIKARKDQYVLRLAKVCMPKLVNLVRRHVPESMLYKIGIKKDS